MTCVIKNIIIRIERPALDMFHSGGKTYDKKSYGCFIIRYYGIYVHVFVRFRS